MRPVACLTILLLAWLGSARAQEPSAQAVDGDPRELLSRAAAWVAGFVADFSNVVAQEDYQQDWTFGERRRLTSDFLLVRYPGRDNVLLAFRDVTSVNGRPASDQQDRLAKLFLEPFEDAIRRAEEISREGSRHSLVELGALSSPFVVIAWLQPFYQPDFTYALGGRDSIDGVPVRRLEIEEIPKPSINPAASAVLRTAATAWIEERTGRVLKTEARAGRAPNTATSTTTFRFDEKLGIHVPAVMKESRIGRTRGASLGASVDHFNGTATYSRFRRFAVRTDEEIADPPGVNP